MADLLSVRIHEACNIATDAPFLAFAAEVAQLEAQLAAKDAALTKAANALDEASQGMYYGMLDDIVQFGAPSALRAAEEARAALSPDAGAATDTNTPLRMHIALRVLRAWNNGTYGFSADVVITINDWIDGGMKGPVPWPDNPFFAEWAEKVGYAKVGQYIGFRFEAVITKRTEPTAEETALARENGEALGGL